MKLDVINLVHEYKSGHKALDGVSFSISSNEPVAIIGQNGAGKTTLVKHFNGILKATSGKVLIDGINVDTKDTSEWACEVGYVFQNPDDQLFLESVRKEFSFGPEQIKMDSKLIEERMELVSNLVGLNNKLDIHPFDLSLTEKKFCTIGAILMMDPKVIIFDEPTCGQDVLGNLRLKKIIKTLQSQGKLCITISHDMKFVTENFSRIIVMQYGRVLLDGPAEKVFSQTDILRLSFVTPPPITRVAQKVGMNGTPFTVPAFVELFNSER